MLDTKVYAFEPVNSSNSTLAIFCAVLAICAIALLIYYNRKQAEKASTEVTENQKRLKPLLSLGLFFVFLISSTTAFFSWWATKKVSSVKVTTEYIETAYGKTNWENIQRIYVHEDQKVAPFSGKSVGEVTKILMIIELDGKTHALSELDYDLNAIGKAIKALQKK